MGPPLIEKLLPNLMVKKAKYVPQKKLLTAVSTFSVALGIGFVMQYGDAVASRLQPQTDIAISPSDVVAPQQASLAINVPVPSISQTLDIPVPVVLAALDTAGQASGRLIDDATGVVPQPACDVTMNAQVLPLVMVALSINARASGLTSCRGIARNRTSSNNS